MPRRQEGADNGINPEALPQLRCPFSRRTLFIFTILSTVWIILVLIYTIILVFVNFNPGTPFSATEQKEIVDAHNMCRANVTPPAKDMQKMVWDNDVAKLAQKWADKCIAKHGGVMHNIGMGQNLFAGGSHGASAVRVWCGEGSNYNHSYNYATSQCKGGWESCAHYTQVVWAKSNKVGCGRSAGGCTNGATMIVCNYFPGGNFEIEGVNVNVYTA